MVGPEVSIADKTGDDRRGRREARPPEQLAWFCDREPLVRRFLGYLHEDARPTILFVHGTGGNGKSLLLRFLHERCCWRTAPQTWRQLCERSLEEVLALGPRATSAPVGTARLDLGARPQGEERPQESLAALFSMKRQLAGAGIKGARHHPREIQRLVFVATPIAGLRRVAQPPLYARVVGSGPGLGVGWPACVIGSCPLCA